MLKHDLAAYLVNLHTLLSAQASNVANPSAVLSAEYDRAWAQLKSEIENETRHSEQPSGGSKTGADQQVSRPMRRS